MSQDEFTKLFKYMEDFRKEVGEQFEENKREHVRMMGAIAQAIGVQLEY